MNMKNKYTSPILNINLISEKDILLGSDVLIDGSQLFEETEN